MKKLIKVASVVAMMTMLSGCIIEHDHGRGPGWGHGHGGGWHHGHGGYRHW
ncbi:hypothetical protein N172_09225 [Pantoea dispersa EGD-AAK13]|jgi:hypothetical protein|uniref:hypothetical protein n=1 Tax=Pantoea TaxID=53335 RepID=UPI000396E653|nr:MULTISPECIES: hypothetical protein [Pantoea]ERH62327.1 hypothetical protein N172_09225 [Pantoea dispersa EGD-AAK13]KAF0853669.1 hypothetical protein Y788_21090 [Pantoea dispersa 625]MBS0899775.1 hypothetical protein [Pantoea dispersa]MBS0907097.1 hypothetical protein [Pantoea dispersa]MBZ6391338.1 hypothetical protein [Pantoea dispersa]